MDKFKDLIGQKFNRWTVVKQAPNKDGRRSWLCKCECGVEREVTTSNLKNGKSKSCGCAKKDSNHNRLIDITGQKFGRLTAISEAARTNPRIVLWNCLCECGNTIIVCGTHLRNSHTMSCGCIKLDIVLARAKHRLSKNPRLTSALAVFKRGYNDGDLTFEQFLELSQLPCKYCNTTFDKSNMYNRYNRRDQKYKHGSMLEDLSLGEFKYNGLDRIDSSKPHNTDNVVPCCKCCNFAKSNKSTEEFLNWIKRVYENSFVKQKETDSSKLESVSELASVS